MESQYPRSHAGETGGTSAQGTDVTGDPDPFGLSRTTAPWFGERDVPSDVPTGGGRSIPAAVPTAHPGGSQTVAYLQAVAPPCICPVCHVDGKFVELRPKPCPPEETRPFRYPGQPQVTNMIFRRTKLVCPVCKGEFDD